MGRAWNGVFTPCLFREYLSSTSSRVCARGMIFPARVESHKDQPRPFNPRVIARSLYYPNLYLIKLAYITLTFPALKNGIVPYLHTHAPHNTRKSSMVVRFTLTLSRLMWKRSACCRLSLTLSRLIWKRSACCRLSLTLSRLMWKRSACCRLSLTLSRLMWKRSA